MQIPLKDRVNLLQQYITWIQDTDSRTEKQDIINRMVPQLKDDFYFILEILDGKHKLGFTFVNRYNLAEHNDTDCRTLREYLDQLYEPMRENNFTELFIKQCCNNIYDYNDFVEPIVNRTLRLGIGRSMLQKEATAPMLAKKYDSQRLLSDNFYITEKLDGNRCIAKFVDGKWTFTSRNGKPMNVDFDMVGFDTNFVYDGEVLSPEQTIASIRRSCGIFDKQNAGEFNATSGLINSKAKNKALVYNVFDVQEFGLPYEDRRRMLDEIACQSAGESQNVRILPVLKQYNRSLDETGMMQLLDDVVNSGGEGLMINTASGLYVPKRTDDLLKVKQVQTMDMKVIDTTFGTGKYELAVGSLWCEATLPNGSKITCSVGTGLSDEQRTRWAMYPMEIIGKIVEVQYFSLSQSKTSYGTTQYSLRFPRLKKIRTDKNETSTY